MMTKTVTSTILSSLLIVPLALALSTGEGLARSYSGLTAADVKSVIGDNSQGVQRCYKRHAKKQRQADGKVLVHLVVKASGKVADVDVEAPSVRGKKFERCVTNVAKRWRFPKASSGTDVTYPFLFVHGARHARNHQARHRR